MQCPACGEEVIPTGVFCHKCGHRLNSEGGDSGQNPPPVVGSASPAGAFQQVAASRWETKDVPEEELWRGGFSPKAMLGGWIISGFAALVLLVVGIIWVREPLHWLILVVAMLLPWLYFLAVLGYRRMSVHYVLSTQRFIYESGILRRVNDRIELLDVDDITFEQRLWERLVGVGTIRVKSSDRTSPELVLPGIDNIKRVVSLFDDARLAERRRRGLHVEQI